jgi:hypothetical protein
VLKEKGYCFSVLYKISQKDSLRSFTKYPKKIF